MDLLDKMKYLSSQFGSRITESNKSGLWHEKNPCQQSNAYVNRLVDPKVSRTQLGILIPKSFRPHPSSTARCFASFLPSVMFEDGDVSVPSGAAVHLGKTHVDSGGPRILTVTAGIKIVAMAYTDGGGKDYEREPGRLRDFYKLYPFSQDNDKGKNFDKLKWFYVVLKDGDALWIPHDWFHCVLTLPGTVAFNLGVAAPKSSP